MGISQRIKRCRGSEFVLLQDAFDEFIIEKRAHNVSSATLHNYTQSYEFFCKFCGYDGETTTDAVTQQDLFKWMNTLKLNGVKPTSVNHYLRDIRAFLYWCMDVDRAYITPPFKIKQVEGQEEPIKLFTDEELEALIVKPRKKDPFAEWRTWAIVNWVLGTGNRAATICELRISDINFAKKEITLRHTKNKKAQTIPLSSSVETVIKEYIRMWRREAPIDGWLFPNIGEEQLTTNALRCAMHRYCNGRGVEKWNIHGLRHNFAKGWVMNNGNMFALQKILGHSTLEMTRRYVKLFSDDIKEDFDKYSPLDTIKRGTKRTKVVTRS